MKLLVVKTTSMGDVVHALPAVSDIAVALPGVCIDWLVEAPFSAIVTMHPNVHRVIKLSWRQWRKTFWQAPTRAAMAACREELRTQRYDAVLDFQGLLKSAIWAHQAASPVWGYDWHSIREPMASLLYARRACVSRQLHAVQRCRRLASVHLGYTLPSTAQADFGLVVPPAPTWQPQQPSYAVLIPCASRVEKRWPVSSWQAIAARCQAHGLQAVVLWGSLQEKQLAEQVASPGAALLPPFLSVRDAAALLAQAQIVVGLDTGFTHLAAALGRPTIGIYCDHEPGLAGVTGAGYVRSFGGRGQVPVLADVQAALDAGLMGFSSDGHLPILKKSGEKNDFSQFSKGSQNAAS
jgi:heptosyltransferase I